MNKRTRKARGVWFPIRSLNTGSVQLDAAIGKQDPLNSRGIPAHATIEIFGVSSQFSKAVAEYHKKADEFLNTQILSELLKNE